MLFLLDTNVLITAHRDYYPIDRVPQFWNWILDQSSKNKIKIPFEIYGELVDGRDDDDLVTWLKSNKNIIQLDENIDKNILNDVINKGYAPDLNEIEIVKIAKDPFLVAYANTENNRCVVTLEISSPKKSRANRKIPDICSTFNITHYNTFQLIRELDFRIK